jgi:hypothetical protein
LNNRIIPAALAILAAASLAACSAPPPSPAAASPSLTAAAASASPTNDPTSTASAKPAGISGSVAQTPAPAASDGPAPATSGGPVTSSNELVDATVQYVLWSLLAGDKKSATEQMTPWYAKRTNDLTGLGLPNYGMEQACTFTPIKLSPQQVTYAWEYVHYDAQTTPGIIITAYTMSCPKEDRVIAAATDPRTMKVAETASVSLYEQERQFGVALKK